MDYDLLTLTEVLRVQKRPLVFWLSQFFTRQLNSTDDKIAFDRVNEDYRRKAPFVAPNVQGKVMNTEGYDTISFKPAYVKPKHVIDANDVIVRRPGEQPGGGLTQQQRRDAVVANILERHADMHMMTQEWMAAKAVIDGKVTVEGDGYPKVTVDFRRDANLTSLLVGGAIWALDGTTGDPLGDIRAMRITSNELCGAVVRDVIFGSEAYQRFSANAKVKDLLNNQVRGSDSNFTKFNDGFGDSVEYLGIISGGQGQGLIRLWQYTGKIRNDAGVLENILDTNTVVGVDGGMLQGFRCFGAIKDGKAGFQALEMFPKVWEEEDPWQELLMTQSAPLMVPKQPNASFSIKCA